MIGQGQGKDFYVCGGKVRSPIFSRFNVDVTMVRNDRLADGSRRSALTSTVAVLVAARWPLAYQTHPIPILAFD
jgi:hypothetical protein